VNRLDDIAAVKKQLEQLNNNIKHVNEKIRINSTATNKIDWNSLIFVTTEKKLVENRFNDGKCDPAGRFWAGTTDLNGINAAGSLYCLYNNFIT